MNFKAYIDIDIFKCYVSLKNMSFRIGIQTETATKIISVKLKYFPALVEDSWIKLHWTIKYFIINLTIPIDIPLKL